MWWCRGECGEGVGRWMEATGRRGEATGRRGEETGGWGVGPLLKFARFVPSPPSLQRRSRRRAAPLVSSPHVPLLLPSTWRWRRANAPMRQCANALCEGGDSNDATEQKHTAGLKNEMTPQLHSVSVSVSPPSYCTESDPLITTSLHPLMSNRTGEALLCAPPRTRLACPDDGSGQGSVGSESLTESSVLFLLLSSAMPNVEAIGDGGGGPIQIATPKVFSQ